MTERSDHRFSATLSSPDLAVIGWMQALAKFSQETGNKVIPCEGTEEKDWRGRWPEGHLPFFNRSISRPFQNEVRRLLPANLVRFVAESDNDPTSLSLIYRAFLFDRNKAGRVNLF